MMKQTDRQWVQRSSEQEKPPWLLLADLISATRQQMINVAQAQEQIHCVYSIFSTQGDIGFDECDYLLTSLQSVQTVICSIHKLFEDTSSLPLVIISLCSPLVAELCRTEECILKLIQRTKTFRSACHEASNPTIRLHYTIICDLETLLEAIGNMPCHFQAICDQVRFLERSSFATVVFGEAVLQTD